MYARLNALSQTVMEDDFKKPLRDGYSPDATGGSPTMKTCFWCGYSSIRVSDLMTHMKVNHPLEYTANEGETPAVAAAGVGMINVSSDENGSSIRRYKCFSCEARFSRSGNLVDHMRRNHPEPFGQPPGTRPGRIDSQMWHVGDRSNTGGAVPHKPGTERHSPGHADRAPPSRKRLAQHPEPTSMDDEEDDDELDIKVIRVVSQCGGVEGTGEGDPFLGKLQSGNWPGDMFRSRSGGAEQKGFGCLLGVLRSAAEAPGRGVDAPTATGNEDGGDQRSSVGSIHVVRVSSMHAVHVGGKGGSGVEIGGSGSGLRAPEKYKCFWCDAHFRKRGKLMDHIDLFHKDSKQQTEVQAELLSGTASSSASACPDTKLRSAAAQPEATAAGKPGEKRCAPASSASAAGANAKLASPALQAGAAVPTKVLACRFVLRATIRSECQPVAEAARHRPPVTRPCKFYFGKLSNPLASSATRNAPSSQFLPSQAVTRSCATACAGGSSAVSLNFGLPLIAVPAAAYGHAVPYTVYCMNGGSGGPVPFYNNYHHHQKSADIARSAPGCVSSGAYGFANASSGSPVPRVAERALMPVQEGASVPLQLHRGLSSLHPSDIPLDLSSRGCRS